MIKDNVKKVMLACSVSVVALVSTGCGTQQTKAAAEQERLVVQQSDTDRLVQKRLLDAATSIDLTLRFIEKIERGDQQERIAGDFDEQRAAREKMGKTAAVSASPAQALASQNTPNTQKSVKQADLPGSSPLDSRLRLSWTKGPADELLRRLAGQIGVGFQESGKKPQVSQKVSIKYENESAKNVLADIGRQLEGAADIAYVREAGVDRLELRYKK